MEIKTTTKTQIILTADDVKEIVTKYLLDKGYVVDTYYPTVKTVYSDVQDQYGTETFSGITIGANKEEKQVEL